MIFESLLFFLAAYIIGSIPFGKIIAKRVARIDITRGGSGNIGATNVARQLGMGWGFVTLLFDVLKGFLPVILFSHFFFLTGGWYEIAVAGIGVCALLGHVFPLFLKFHGGKGVATALGVYLAISPLSCLCCLVLFVLVVMVWDFISLGSIVSGAAMPLFLLAFGEPWPIVIASLIMALFIVWKHKENIQRLMRGEELKWKGKRRQVNKSSSRSNSSSE